MPRRPATKIKMQPLNVVLISHLVALFERVLGSRTSSLCQVRLLREFLKAVQGPGAGAMGGMGGLGADQIWSTFLAEASDRFGGNKRGSPVAQEYV